MYVQILSSLCCVPLISQSLFLTSQFWLIKICDDSELMELHASLRYHNGQLVRL
jgi:hypothetical protein